MIVILEFSTFDEYYQIIKENYDSKKLLAHIVPVENNDLSSCVLVFENPEA